MPALATSVPASAPIVATPVAVISADVVKQESTPKPTQTIEPLVEKLPDTFALITPPPVPSVPVHVPVAANAVAVTPAVAVKELTPKPTLKTIAPVVERLSDTFALITPAAVPSVPIPAPIAANPVAATPAVAVKQELTPKPTLRTIAPVAVKLSDPFTGIAPAQAPSVPASAPITSTPAALAQAAAVISHESTSKSMAPQITAPIAEKLADPVAQIAAAPAPSAPAPAETAAASVPVVPTTGVNQESIPRPTSKITARIVEKLAGVFARLAPAPAPLVLASAPIAATPAALAPATAAVKLESMPEATPLTTAPVAEKLPGALCPASTGPCLRADRCHPSGRHSGRHSEAGIDANFRTANYRT